MPDGHSAAAAAVTAVDPVTPDPIYRRQPRMHLSVSACAGAAPDCAADEGCNAAELQLNWSLFGSQGSRKALERPMHCPRRSTPLISYCAMVPLSG